MFTQIPSLTVLILLVGFGILVCKTVVSQTHDWWAKTVKWDGITHWSHYINFNPGYLGPNALPVPELRNGLIDSNYSVSVSAAAHFSKGDKTFNPVFAANYCIVKNKLSVDLLWVPVEYFQMSHELKEQRHVFYQAYNSRKAMGDVHMNINLQLLNPEKFKQALAFRTGFRYPSSSNVAAARMTDAPGYFFDVSTSHSFTKRKRWKYVLMAGFLVWQMSNNVQQNDAVLFGAGLEYNKKYFQLQSYVAGYIGYICDGDQPVVYRFKAGTSKAGLNWTLQLQQGLNDFSYSSIEAGTKYVFKQCNKKTAMKPVL